jgi:hypothetical protein
MDTETASIATMAGITAADITNDSNPRGEHRSCGAAGVRPEKIKPLDAATRKGSADPLFEGTCRL